ncbi:MAG: Mini-ribonuclease 3 [Firmicutes bacterium]|nr:Mini-ribonuclease 3 [Bacillota bacterium]
MTEKNWPPLLLAYIGDAVYELYVRQKICKLQLLPVRQLHKKVIQYVRAEGQDEALRLIEPFLTPEEARIVRHGRNTKNRVPRNAQMSAYRRATGFETLLGWLYLTNQTRRLEEILALIKVGEEEKK